jgi:hypothetical protein
VRLVAMIHFSQRGRALEARGYEVVAAEATCFGPSMVRRTDLLSSRVRTYDSTPRNRRLRSRATRAISEKPRIRRDKAVARQTGETPQKSGSPRCPRAMLIHCLFTTCSASP